LAQWGGDCDDDRFDEVDSRIHDLAERENECEGLFEEIKNGNGEKSLRYLELRDSCKELRKGIFKSAMSAGLTRERIKTEIVKARKPVLKSNSQQPKSVPSK
jgi:hypothetical protein